MTLALTPAPLLINQSNLSSTTMSSPNSHMSTTATGRNRNEPFKFGATKTVHLGKDQRPLIIQKLAAPLEASFIKQSSFANLVKNLRNYSSIHSCADLNKKYYSPYDAMKLISNKEDNSLKYVTDYVRNERLEKE